MQNMAVLLLTEIFLNIEAREVYGSYNYSNTVPRYCAMADSYGVHLNQVSIQVGIIGCIFQHKPELEWLRQID